ncbi:MAG: hypothetical protein ACM34N_03190 [Ignavibacteria bacterium]
MQNGLKNNDNKNETLQRIKPLDEAFRLKRKQDKILFLSEKNILSLFSGLKYQGA